MAGGPQIAPSAMSTSSRRVASLLVSERTRTSCVNSPRS